MRILVLDTHYPESLRLTYGQNGDLSERPFREQLKAIYDTGFGRADSLPINLQKVGHVTDQFIVNAEFAQLSWARENRVGLGGSFKLSHVERLSKRAASRFSLLADTPGVHVPRWQLKVVEAQVKSFKPDVIFVCDVLYLPAKFLQQLKRYTSLLVGEMAYPIPPNLDLRPFDLIISAAPHYVDRLRQAGAKSELLRLAFEPTILDRLNSEPKDEAVVFIGSVSAGHQQRLDLLETLCRNVSLSCWGHGAETLPLDSPLRGRMKKPLWGYDMYRQLQRAKIALNIHIDMAEGYAANMRLYEATGVGTMLLTDWKTNLHEMFEINKEVAAYRSVDECVELVQYYLQRDVERELMAQAGQKRTLSEHTYYQRMQELTGILERYLPGARARYAI